MGTEAGTDTVILLDDASRGDGGCLLLRAPERIVAACTPAEVEPALVEIERALACGLHAAGFFSYELGYLLEPRLAPLLPAARDLPLLWMGLFRTAQRLDAAAVRRWLPPATPAATVSDVRASIDREGYRCAFARARALIAAGDAYQINLTLKLDFRFDGDPRALYAALRRRQRVGHGALIIAPDFRVLSLSPELFLRVDGGRAQVRPMKGTAARAATPAEDDAVRAHLQADEKSRAENLMIVDLLRNDLGRLSPPGGVRVTDLFTVETFRSLHQMTSGIEATLRPGTGLRSLLAALFPCGSVTGAPKIRAMQIIRALEPAPRGVYCGAIGLLVPGGDAFFNVAIRTLLLRPDGRGELGIGSGVVFDSDADAEYDECLLKAAFLTRPEPPLTLIETLAWQPARRIRVAGPASRPAHRIGGVVRAAAAIVTPRAPHWTVPRSRSARGGCGCGCCWTKTATSPSAPSRCPSLPRLPCAGGCPSATSRRAIPSSTTRRRGVRSTTRSWRAPGLPAATRCCSATSAAS